MNKRFSILSALLALMLQTAMSQVSHGGKPLPWNALPGMQTRGAETDLFVDMPSFDVGEELRIDSLNENDLRSGFRFAYKFMTDYTPANSGINFTLPDGTRVWRLGIRSEGAYSINVLFTKYEVPEGSQLFLYNSDRSHILGSFNHLNNSAEGILPVAPVQGDELIIEYQEPAKASFRGRLKVGEVNHAYRDLRGSEPKPNSPVFKCISPLSCFVSEGSPYEAPGRSVIMMFVDGIIACTGTLMNNMQNDGTPYVLTASHCLNGSFTVSNPDYQQVAGRIVFFFNYDSPTCNTVLKGAEEMSVASAKCKAINEQTDMALLELSARPPVYYQPYYAGWNATGNNNPPYAGIHHPGGTIKRINWAEEKVTLETFNTTGTSFNTGSHWQVHKWANGSTAGGSSGSALFDSDGYVIGALSGGLSNCSYPENDFYYALCRTWNTPEESDKQLKYWLDPHNTSELTCQGLDPYGTTHCKRLSNVEATGLQETVEITPISATNAEPLFGNNSLGITEFAEAYNANGKALLYGAYFVTSATKGNYNDMNVEVTVYAGTNKPQILLHREAFRPTYRNLNVTDDSFQETNKPLNSAQETYIHFSQPVAVEGMFFVGYRISAPKGTLFSVYNLPKGETSKNTAWIKYNKKWTEATAYPQNPFRTSLYVDPVIQYSAAVGIEKTKEADPILIYVGTDRKTLHIVLPAEASQADYELLSLEGKKIQSGQIVGNTNDIALNTSVKGIYLVKITCNNRTRTQKVLF